MKQSSLRSLSLLVVVSLGTFGHSVGKGDSQKVPFKSVEEVEAHLSKKIRCLKRGKGQVPVDQEAEHFNRLEHLKSKREGLYLEKEINKLIEGIQRADLDNILLVIRSEDVVIHEPKLDLPTVGSSLHLAIEREKRDSGFTWIVQEYYKFLKLISMGGYASECGMLSERHKYVIATYLSALSEKSSKWRVNSFNNENLEVSEIIHLIESAKTLADVIHLGLRGFVMVHTLPAEEENIQYTISTIKEAASKYLPFQPVYLRLCIQNYLNKRYGNELGETIQIESAIDISMFKHALGSYEQHPHDEKGA